MSRPDLVLVGIPGSGKSAVAALFAAAHGLRVVEVGELVEADLGAFADEVFVADGEAAYREAEERVTVAALNSGGVVALTSGAVDSAAVRTSLEGLPVVWLRTSVATATRRLGMNAFGMEALVALRRRMATMLEERAPRYAAVAAMVVDTDRLTAAQVAATVDEWGGGR